MPNDDQILTVNEATIILVAEILRLERNETDLQMGDAAKLIGEALKALR